MTDLIDTDVTTPPYRPVPASAHLSLAHESELLEPCS